MLIHTYVDDFMSLLMAELGYEIPEYDPQKDPSKDQTSLIEWTISDLEVKKMRLLYERRCCKMKKKLKEETDQEEIDVKKFKLQQTQNIGVENGLIVNVKEESQGSEDELDEKLIENFNEPVTKEEVVTV